MVDFIAKLNIRQILIHFVATWLFVYAFYTLGGLFDYKFLYVDPVNLGPAKSVHRIIADKQMINNVAFVGLGVAIIISILITRKWKWGIINPLLLLIVIFILKYFGALGWTQLQGFFLFPGSLIGKDSIGGFCLDSAIMLLFGSYLFFQKDIQQFIDKANTDYDAAGAHKPAKR